MIMSGFRLLLFVSLIAAQSSLLATTIGYTAIGRFGSDVTTTSLSAANATFSLEFRVDTFTPVNNSDLLGFDVPFYAFRYTLNGAQVSTSPASIRFATAANLGLFTAFFGPQSGFINGVPVPEFQFEGSQLFTGSTSSPSLLTGRVGVSSWTFSDATNFDLHVVPAGALSVVASEVPEPSTWTLLIGSEIFIAAARLCVVLRERMS